MVRLQDVRTANLELVKKQSIVAAFVGGTSGICESALRALANAHSGVGKGLRAYIIGRNEKAAQTIISDCQKICPAGRFTFVKADNLALIRDVDAACKKLLELEQKEEQPRLDILIMSQACPPWNAAEETSEGLDTFMSLVYHSRIRTIENFLPLLNASKLPAHAVSIYAAGSEGKLIADDLLLRKPGNNTLTQARSHVTYMTTLYMEHLSREHPNLSLVHVFPGLVLTPAFNDPSMPILFWYFWNSIGKFAAKFYAVPLEESGERTLFLATSRYPSRSVGASGSIHGDATADAVNETALGTDGTKGSGAYAINWNGESFSVANAYKKHDKAELSRTMVEHTKEVFRHIEEGKPIEN